MLTVSPFVDVSPGALSSFVDTIAGAASGKNLAGSAGGAHILFILNGLRGFTFLLQLCGTAIALSIGADER